MKKELVLVIVVCIITAIATTLIMINLKENGYSFNQCIFIHDELNPSAFTGENSCEGACKNAGAQKCLLGEIDYSTTFEDTNSLNIPCNLNIEIFEEEIFGNDSDPFVGIYGVSCICCT